MAIESNQPDDPFGDLPPEIRAFFEQMGGTEGIEGMQEQMSGLFGMVGGMGAFGGSAPTGPVDWDLATRVALQIAAEGDRSPTDEQQRQAEEALQLAEHWLDASNLPSAPDAGSLFVANRQTWVNAAITTLRPMIEDVASATADALIELAEQQLGQVSGDELDEIDPAQLEQMGIPAELTGVIRNLLGGDIGKMLRPASAGLAGLQAGQVIGQLSQQLLGQYELGIPTAPRSAAYYLAANVDEAFEGYGLDPTEVALVIMLNEAAHRRLYHAVPWLEEHVRSLVGSFAAGTEVDGDRLRRMAEDLMTGVDPDDPDALREAMGKAAGLRLEPTPEQLRILERLQGVVCLVGAWARHEVTATVTGRLPNLDRIQEVLRRRRATRGDGEQLMAGLLGLDLKPTDESIGERFVAAVESTMGIDGLHRALAHPENLPDADELADPGGWIDRLDGSPAIPDDASALFGDLGEAPPEGGDADPDDEDPPTEG